MNSPTLCASKLRHHRTLLPNHNHRNGCNNPNRCLRLALVLMWWVSGFLPLLIYLPSHHHALDSLRSRIDLELLALGWGAFSPQMTAVTLCFAAVVNGLLGAFALWGQSQRLWLAQFITVLGYTLILTWSHGALWLDSFGSLLKNLPILVILWQQYRAAAYD